MASLPLPIDTAAAPAAGPTTLRAPERTVLRLVEPGRAPAPAQRLDTDLPPALIKLMVGAFGAFLTIMAATFAAPDGMGIVLAICFVCLAGYFGLPWAMVRTGPATKQRRTLSGLLKHGMELPDGHCHGGEAVGLVLLMPVVLLLWAVFIGVMHAQLF